MVTLDRPPRSWEVDDLLDLGEKEGVRYLKAIPVLILERWVEGKREQDVANYVRTKELARRLVSSGLVRAFKPKGTSNILGALGAIQASRNLTRPPLMKYKGGGMSWVNLPHYESLLQEYRQEYCKGYSEDYGKLFAHGEPQWQIPRLQTSSVEVKATSGGSDVQKDIQSLLAPIERALGDREKAVARLTQMNQQLQADVEALQTALQESLEAPRRRIMDEELANDCAKHLENKETYIDAIRRAGVVLEERLRQTIGGDGPEKFKEGIDLVDFSLLPNSGRLIISDHPAEQEGVRMLFRGAVQFIRNPPAHKKVQYAELEAWQAIGLIDYLLLLLPEARIREA